jgi:hypothetical protein
VQNNVPFWLIGYHSRYYWITGFAGVKLTKSAHCCGVEDWPDADELDCYRLLEMANGMPVGCRADNRRDPSPSNGWNRPQIQAGVCRLPEGGLFKSYTALLARSSAILKSFPIPIELRFQFRYAAPQPPRLLQLDSATLWFPASGEPAKPVVAADPCKVEPADVRQALAGLGAQAPVQPTPPTNHDTNGEFETHRTNGHRHRLPARLRCPG